MKFIKLTLRGGCGVLHIDPDDIRWLEVLNDWTTLHTKSSDDPRDGVQVCESMGEIVDMIDNIRVILH